MQRDPISDLIIRLKNASSARKQTVAIPHTNFVFAVLQKLADKGYIQAPAKKGKKLAKSIEVELIYDKDGSPRITDAKRLSKPSKRIYRGADEIFKIKQGHGSTIISTPKGVLADDEARKNKVGGEVLFSIW